MQHPTSKITSCVKAFLVITTAIAMSFVIPTGAMVAGTSSDAFYDISLDIAGVDFVRPLVKDGSAMTVVGSGVAGVPRSDVQFDYAIAAVAGSDAAGDAISTGRLYIGTNEGVWRTVIGIVTSIQIIGSGPDDLCVVVGGRAHVELPSGRRYPRVPVVVTLTNDSLTIDLDLGRDGKVHSGADVLIGGNGTERFAGETLITGLGAGADSTGEGEIGLQLAAAIAPEGEAVGQVSAVAETADGVVLLQGSLVGGLADGVNPSGRFRTLNLSGPASANLIRPDGTLSETCFGGVSLSVDDGHRGTLSFEFPDCDLNVGGRLSVFRIPTANLERR